MILRMRFFGHLLLVALLLLPSLGAAPLARPEWNRVAVEPMKTSIYVGSVRLITAEFRKDGDGFSATYAAKVFPWAFWNETGRIHIAIAGDDLARLQRGERCEFTGEAFNHKEKPRRVTGYADPESADGSTGKIKVRIAFDDMKLTFNGRYTLSTFTAQPAADQSAQ